jgi:hypothetical protein
MKVNFVDRLFVYRRIDEFLSRWSRGYLTLIGSPGAGKSVILSQYAADNPHVVYYNAQLPGNNRADKFLREICTQLLERLGERNELPDNVTEGSWFLSQLLQRISDNGRTNALIISIDGCERIDLRYQSPGSNLFYLPRYLPDNIYFLLSRRPFPKDKSGLLTESPCQSLDLREYPKENREDVRTYVEIYFASCAVIDQAKSEKIIANSDGNFMYVSQLLPEIHTESLSGIPSGLVSYYQSHLKKMQGSGLFGVRLKLLRLLAQESKFLPAKKMATAINEDKFDVKIALEDWREFFVEQLVDGQPFYRLYHHHFQEWLLTEIER